MANGQWKIQIMQEILITNSFEETQKLGINFSNHLKGGDVLALHGDLGTGKTTFVQGLARGLGIKKNITSPTFIIVRQYGIPSPQLYFYHIDLYRVENENEIEGLGLLEIINDSKNIVAIEWAEKIEKLLPKKRINLLFEHLEKNRRKITI